VCQGRVIGISNRKGVDVVFRQRRRENQVGEMGLDSERKKKKRVVRAGETGTRDGERGWGRGLPSGKKMGIARFRSSMTYLYSLLWKFRFVDF
jgi:hypothetical protein